MRFWSPLDYTELTMKTWPVPVELPLPGAHEFSASLVRLEVDV